MDRARIHEGIRRMGFEDVLGRAERSELSQMEAAELLGVSERTFRRWRDRQREHGAAGLLDRRLQPSLRRAPVAEIERMLGLYRDLYRGFTVKHFHEQLGKRHGYTLGYTVTKLHLHQAGLVRPAKTRSAHRKKRPRRPMVGMMLHQDASTHARLAGVAGKQDLVVTMEDATSALYWPSWWTRRAQRQACAVCAKWWRSTGCSARSTPIGAATTSRRRRQVHGCRRRC
jgi:transposase